LFFFVIYLLLMRFSKDLDAIALKTAHEREVLTRG